MHSANLVQRLAMAVVALSFCTAANAQPLTQDGSPGVHGTPYGYIGPLGTRIWENYRRHVDSHPTPYPAVTATNGAAADRLLYANSRMGGAVDAAYISPGLWVGTTRSLRSYPWATPALVECLKNGARERFDIRLGFAEHLASGGGAPFSTFIANNGGENSWMDLYAPNWGVDGLDMQIAFDNSGPTWIFHVFTATLVAPASDWEFNRTNRAAEVTFDAAPIGGGYYDAAVPSDVPLALTWHIEQQGASTSFEVSLGPTARFSWIFDDGASRTGLSDPGNFDGQPYQGGGMDLASFIPVMFIGLAVGDSIEPLPPGTFELAVVGTVPVISDFPTVVRAGRTHSFTVTATDATGALEPGFVGQVFFASTDPSATIPATHDFVAADQGRRTFSGALSTAGLQSLSVALAAEPAVSSSLPDIDVVDRAPYDVTLACSSIPGAAGAPWALLLLALGRARRR